MNAAYRKALAGTVWANYQLVITQWPTGGRRSRRRAPASLIRKDPRPVPGQRRGQHRDGDVLPVAGRRQGAGGNSCMPCHFNAGVADFSWSLLLRSH